MTTDGETVSWEEWGAIFHRAVKDFVRDAGNARPDPESPMGRFVATLRVASEEYDLHLATQDTERLEGPSAPGVKA
jgi:hypothetical protein